MLYNVCGLFAPLLNKIGVSFSGGVFFFMLKCFKDIRLIIGFLLAHVLLFFTFSDNNVFWYIFTASMLFLMSYSIFNEEIEDRASVLTYFSIGIISGAVLFAIFFLGDFLIDLLNLPFKQEISLLYKQMAPSEIWHYIVLILILIPGEEIFWRGFIQKRINKTLSLTKSVLISSVMYASVLIYSGTFILPVAALVSGICWGYLYGWKKSLPLAIVSHLVFDIFLFVIYPLN